jgi:hypothetical protein
MQSKIMTWGWLTDPFKIWHSSNIWEQQQQSKFDPGGN